MTVSYNGTIDIDTPLVRPPSVVDKHIFDDNDENTPINPFRIPKESNLAKLKWFLLFPINFLFFITVPDCRRKSFNKFPLYFLTFVMSTVYLGVLTYAIVWMVVIIG